MNYKQQCAAEQARIEYQIEILKLREKLYDYSIFIGIDERMAERIANGTLFDCNSDYRASGRGLSAGECDEINFYYAQIEHLLNEIKATR
ncbi:MAG: hypothetical protein LCH81_00955 [Bacteroidetes bacterium]|nr:hypothetical protein [Bacteroidota bacterium]